MRQTASNGAYVEYVFLFLFLICVHVALCCFLVCFCRSVLFALGGQRLGLWAWLLRC